MQIFSYDVYPKIIHPTRLSHSGGTLIDNVFCRSPDFSSLDAGILATRLSDHQPYFVSLDIEISNKTSRPQYFTKYPSVKSKALFGSKISSSMISDQLDQSEDASPETNFNILHSVLTSAKTETLLPKTVRLDKRKHPLNPWMTRGILVSINHKNELYKQLKNLVGESENFIILNRKLSVYQKILRKCIKSAKKKFNSSQIEKSKDDPRKLWQIINDIISPNSRQSNNLPEYFIIDDKKVQNDREISESFNTFFTNIASELVSDLGPPPESFENYLKDPINTTFQFSNVSQTDVEKAINSLKSKKTQDCDGLSTELIKSIKDDLLKPLTIIINQVINTAIFPSKLKVARVAAVYKNGEKTILNNYRPISILPIISKIIERILHTQISEYFCNKKLLYSSQYGFRSGHSTELAAAEMVDRIISNFDNRKYYLSVYMDLSKAFDCIDYGILLTKLKHYGFSEHSLKLIENYLSDRYQFVKIRDVESSLLPINIGVPQGSILGPLLFVIYINDICKSSDLFEAILYADDSTFSIVLDNLSNNSHENSINSYDDKTRSINIELQKIEVWLKSNRLCLNKSKTKYMIFHRGNEPKMELSIGDSSLEQVQDFQFLGITLNQRLDWSSHIEITARKVARGIGVLKRVKPYVPFSALKTLYYSLIHCHLQYQILNWGHDSDMLLKLQKRAIRFLTSEDYLAHTEPLFKRCNILKVNDLYNLSIVKFYFNYLNDKLPAYFRQISFPQNRDIHNLDTRFKNDLSNPKINHEFARNIPRNKIPGLINSLGAPMRATLRNASSMETVVKCYKTEIFQSYQSSHLCGEPGCHVCYTLYRVI